MSWFVKDTGKKYILTQFEVHINVQNLEATVILRNSIRHENLHFSGPTDLLEQMLIVK